LLGVELGAGRRPSTRVGAVLAVVVVAAVASNLRVRGDGARYLRDSGRQTRVVLGALDLGRGAIPPGFVVSDLPGFPFVRVTAGQSFSAERDLGTPAAGRDELAAMPEFFRRVVDAQLV